MAQASAVREHYGLHTQEGEKRRTVWKYSIVNTMVTDKVKLHY